MSASATKPDHLLGRLLRATKAFFSELINPHNDCLEVATELEGEILEALVHLKLSKNHLYQPRMTGTGSCAFVEFKHEKDALVALNNLPSKWSGFVALALNTSPN